MSVPWWRISTGGVERVRREVDVAVIGGGVTGVSALRAAVESGAEAVLLERGRVGGGASSRNAGYLMRGCADNYARACDEFGRDRACELWRLSEESLRLLLRWGAASCPGFAWRPSCLLADEPIESAELERSLDLLLGDGFDAEGLSERGRGDVLTSRLGSTWVGLVNPGDAVCVPSELIDGIVGPVRGCVREGVEVFAIEPGGAGGDGRVVVHAEGGGQRLEVAARWVFVCTNAWAGELCRELAGEVVPNRGQMLALDGGELADGGEGPVLSRAYYLERGCDYIRQSDRGTIVVGGRRHGHADAERVASDAWTWPVQRDLEDLAERLLGVRLPVVHRWGGVMGFSSTGLPVVRTSGVGDVGAEELGGRVVAIAGFTGHGMSLAAEVARDAVAGALGGGLGGRRWRACLDAARGRAR